MKKIILIVLVLALCGGGYFMLTQKAAYKDGVYEASHNGNFGETRVKLTIKDNAIAECELVLIDKAGKVKDANYDYENADEIVQVMKEYPEMLVKAGSVEEFEKLDAISGATVTFKEFALAAKDALAKAR